MSKKDKNKIIILSLVFLITLANVVYEKYIKKEPDFVSVYEKEAFDGTNEDLNYVHFINAGQGDSTLIQTADGRFILIDTSTDSQSTKVVSYLEYAGVKEIEYLFLTHPHEDHIGGADEVLENFVVKNIVMTDKVEPTACFERLIESLKSSKKENDTKVIKPGYLQSFNVDELEMTVISDGSLYEDLNDSSICLKVSCGQSDLLFTGDAEKDVEADILEKAIDVGAEIYKCAHHGSSTSNSEKFLDKVNPSVAVVSCGENNMYGHPHEEVLKSLYDRDIKVYVTYKDGDVVFAFDEDELFRVLEFVPSRM